MTADQLDWPMLLLGSLGADFEVIAPPELLDRVRDWGRRFSQASLEPTRWLIVRQLVAAGERTDSRAAPGRRGTP